ncbi:hypothetical protein CY34DRAFT_477529 [Suillus luteus UH-Slu-Lm8-n1]|uniref:Uncharacterized protein n=1 Tax=Suillus luteus UH-Slu-Lm8-n1 TaxID=930992 RepID=A0A0C9ZI77_9AGAM|nr:hypothetical protein CY34DRAFT_477529 [Suillus luteus UH-Slu-Lm8-n1]
MSLLSVNRSCVSTSNQTIKRPRSWSMPSTALLYGSRISIDFSGTRPLTSDGTYSLNVARSRRLNEVMPNWCLS